VVYQRQWRPLVLAAGLAVGVWAGVRWPLYDLLGVTKVNALTMNMWSALHVVAAHVAAGTPLSEAERAYLDEIRPVSDGWPYDPHVTDCLLFCDKGAFNLASVQVDPSRVWNLAGVLTWRRPLVTMAHMINKAWQTWRVIRPKVVFNDPIALLYSSATGTRYNVPLRGCQDCPGMDSQVPELADALARLYVASTRGYWNVWLPATYFYLLLGGTVVAALRRRNWRVLLIAWPIVVHSVALMVSQANPYVRYQYPVILASLVLWPGLFLCSPEIIGRREVGGSKKT